MILWLGAPSKVIILALPGNQALTLLNLETGDDSPKESHRMLSFPRFSFVRHAPCISLQPINTPV